MDNQYKWKIFKINNYCMTSNKGIIYCQFKIPTKIKICRWYLNFRGKSSIEGNKVVVKIKVE